MKLPGKSNLDQIAEDLEQLVAEAINYAREIDRDANSAESFKYAEYILETKNRILTLAGKGNIDVIEGDKTLWSL